MTDHALFESLVSQKLDEYHLLELLGQGGMARVYRALDPGLKRTAAIKVISSPYRTDPGYKARFLREARAIAQLRHPNIVRLYRYGEANELLYIAMEFIDGPDLSGVLAAYVNQQKMIPPQEVSRIIRQICRALDYAHGQGVIHRDIKPSNIMVNKQGEVIVTDFGLVLLSDERTRGEIFGTPNYIAPEQAISSANAVPQSDLYAVGIILYEMFTTRLPFEATHPYDVALKHIDEAPPPPSQINPDLSPAIEAVILKALAKDPEARYQSGADLADALDLALAELIPTASPVEARSRRSFPEHVALKLALASRVDTGPEPPNRNKTTEPAPPVAAGGANLSNLHKAKQGKVLASNYILKNIRALLTELTATFSEAQIRQLCAAVPDFKPVHHQLTISRGKAEIVDLLLDYAEQTLQIDELLALAKEYNLEIYNRHKPYYELVSAGRNNLIGQALGKYHLVERLGHGGMADVYKAFQSGLARYVAIKVIHGRLLDDEEFIERFEREAMAVASLHHPNIVQVFDFDREEDRYFMVMELINGSTLAEELKIRQGEGAIYSLGEVVEITTALASAIDYAHQQGMIHRDLKPGNVMFTRARRVVLTDFGIARVMDIPSYTMTNAIVGTPAYMSPEQAKGRTVDHRSDIFSLGVILYEMLTGQAPFQADQPLTVILKLVNDPPLPPSKLRPDLPVAVEDVILKALSKNPAERHASAGRLAQSLYEAVSQAGDDTLPSRQWDLQKINRAISGPEAGDDQSEPNRAIEKAKIPEIQSDTPAGQTSPPEDPFLPKRGGVISISGNTGQIALGGQNLVQIGPVSGGDVSVGRPTEPAQPGSQQQGPAFPRQALADLKALIERTAIPPRKRTAALERLDELVEAALATPSDLDTMAYVNNWFAKQLPAMAKAVTRLITHPQVQRLISANAPALAADYAQRFGLPEKTQTDGSSADFAEKASEMTLVGRRLGAYHITERIGQGGVARVYKGYAEGTNQEVALKVVFRHITDDKQFRARFQRETDAIARLRHPHVVRIYESGVEQDMCYVAMEYIPGGDLRTVLERLKASGAPFPLKHIIRIAREAALALDYVHGHRILHHNLKPSNIMFARNGQVVVTDFGLARLMGARKHTIAGSSWRTPAYMSPEHASGNPDDARGDIYALGVILYEMATRRLPFTANTPVALMMKLINEPVTPPRDLNPSLPPAVEQVILKTLAKQPTARYQTAAELAQALAGFV